MKTFSSLILVSGVALTLLAIPKLQSSQEPEPAPKASAASGPGVEQSTPEESGGPVASALDSTGGLEFQDEVLEELRARAEKRYAEGSFQLAHRIYEEATALELSDDARRWVEFRLADTRWRAASATNDPDTTELERGAADLARSIATVQRPEDQDRIWAEAQESLGRYHWNRPRSQNWGAGWAHFQAALEWWSGSSDLELARQRYLDIVFDAVQPSWYEAHWGRGGYSYLPVDILENAVEIAEGTADAPRAHFLLGVYYANQGQNIQFRGRAVRELSAVIEAGKGNPWYDDALYQLGSWFENNGRAQRNSDGHWQWSQDFVAAVALYRRILREFDEGETSWHDDAESRISQITDAHLWISVDQFFLPGSEINYRVQWRNVKEVELALYKADLTRDVRFDENGPGGWLESVRLERLAAERRWTYSTGDSGEHRPDQSQLALEDKLPPGAWVLTASARGHTARALVLVSDVALTSKATGDRLLAWLTDVQTGEPVPEADVRLWQYYWHEGSWRWRRETGRTAADGTLLFELGHTPSHAQYFLAAADGDRQAYVQSGTSASPSASDQWRLYAFTDRSTYRPGHEVNWKLIARRYDGSTYSTPVDAELEWELIDPMGSTVGKGDGRLDAFGAASSTFLTEAEMPLGEYTVHFYENRKHDHGDHVHRQHVGNATLFRLEEYKRPEFEVSVDVPEDAEGSRRPKLYQVGDRVEVEVGADYYFGGAVAEANVEVFVWQKPYYHTWSKEREFPWFYTPTYQNWWGGNGQQISHQILKTDASGRCLVAFDTPLDSNGDFEYTIEARVVDSSRREILGRGTVRVTRSEFYAQIEAEHAIHRPGAAVELNLTTVDANGNPLPARGKVQVTRQRWVEIWRDSSGRRVSGSKLDEARREKGFPLPGWSLHTRGYEQDMVLEIEIETGEDGQASWELTPDRDGMFNVSWKSIDSRGTDVAAHASVFVADEFTRELGYLPGGVQILVDQDTVEVGEDTPLLLVTPVSGRWVLFTVEGDDLYHYEVIRLDGTVKLIRLEITEAHVPNVQLGAVSVAGGEAFVDAVELIVPPVKQFLDIELTHDRETVLPGDEGMLSVTVRDRDGKPVSAQLALAVVDDSLAYIQGDYAGDPRKFFYGQKRSVLVNTFGTVHHGAFRRLVKDEDGEIRDERTVKYDGKDGFERSLGKENTRYDYDRRGRSGGKNETRFKMAAKSGLALPASRMANAPMESMESMEEMVMDQVGSIGGFGDDISGEGGAQADPTVRVRTDFRETALWMAAVTTDENGRATVEVPFPDSTTRWSTTVRAADGGARFGIGRSTVRSRQPLIARLQAPRFFVVGDEVTVSGNLNNNTDGALSVLATLEVEGLELLGRIEDGRLVSGGNGRILIPAESQERVDWRVRVLLPGEALLRLTAVGAELGDAIERTYPIFPHGIEALIARSGRFDDDELAFSLDLPAARGAGSTTLTVQVSPSIAVTMLDALPYLVDYPYGCTEQTLSRFVPSVIVSRTLRDQGLSPEDVLTRVFGGIEPEFVDQTHRQGKRALEELDEMVAQGLKRLYDFQRSDGGWGWWPESDSDRFMTAYVLWGLSLARDAGIEVRPGVLENAARWLAKEMVQEERRLDEQAWLLHALAVYGGQTGDARSNRWIEQAFDNLWGQRTRLNAYGRSLFTIAAHEMGRQREARILADNLIDGAIVDASPDTSIVQVGGGQSNAFVMKTAHWGVDGVYNRWSDGAVEATAFALRALAAIDPDHELVEPAMNWLVKNRRGAQWSNTRDTAITVLALNDYLKASGELAGDIGFEVLVNGRSIARRELSAEDLLRAPSRFDIDPDTILDGENEIRIRRTKGDGPLYFAAHATFFSREEPIPARGNEIFVRREYYKLVGRPTLLKGFVYDRVALGDGDTVNSGERIEVVVTVEAKNDLEYMIFEDLKPAGFEATQVRSGEPMAIRQLKQGEAEQRFTGAGVEQAPRGAYARSVHEPGYTGASRSVHQELRDRKVAFFVDRMADGLWELRYDLRAETPGSFHALPLLAHAMYVPEIRANGNELRIEVLEELSR